MKALTIRQPWASLVATGVKTIETRSWSTKYRGPLAIHAGKVGAAFQMHPEWDAWEALAEFWGETDGEGLWHECAAGEGYQEGYRTPPFGAVIATCELVDVLPISLIDHDAGRTEDRVVDMPLFRGLHLRRDREDVVIEDQRPYGDFAAGRFAWMLADIKPTTQRCPLCWGAGSWPYFTRQVCPLCCVKKVTEPVPARGRQGLWNWEWER
jgi:hypothetical protein